MLVVFEGGDHSLHFSEPEWLAKEINDFLDALLAAALDEADPR
jgi:hypothetical protein